MASFADGYARLLDAATARRRHLPARLISSVAIAAIIHWMIGLSYIWAWVALYWSVQLFEGVLLGPLFAGAWTRPSRLKMLAIVALFIVSAMVMSALSVGLWLSGGRYGPAIAVFMVSGAILNLIIMSATSQTAFAASAAPYMATVVAMMFIDPQMLPQHRALVAVGAVLLLTNAVITWRMFERTLGKERQAAAELEQQRAALEAAMRTKSAYVAVVSHELRTPITAITAGAAHLQRHLTDPDQRGHARAIARAGGMMRTLLSDLLDFSRLEAGRLSVEHIPFDLRHKIADVLRLWRPAARREGLRLRLEGGVRTPKWVSGDPMRIAQVLHNLVSNAIKFTPAGGTVTVRLDSRVAEDGRIVIEATVSDTGPGLSKEALSRLFSPFEQGDVSTARIHGGSGLGLAISRELARVMGGDLTAVSRPGEGSVFLLNFRVHAVEAPEPRDVKPAVTGARVLVVDDHPGNRRALELILEPLGVRPTLADSGETALQILERERFDVVLMDVYMPGLDGRETTRRLRAGQGVNRLTPVVAITASSTPRDWEECRQAGMVGRVAKPIEPSELYSVLAEALAAGRTHAPAPAEQDA